MKPKFRYTNEADIPEVFKSLYVKGADGQWTMDIDGGAEMLRLTEFRENNIALNKELNEIKAKYNGIDPVEALELKSKAEEIRSGKVVKQEGVEALIAERTKAVAAAKDAEIAAIKTKFDGATIQLARLTIHGKATDIGTKAGLRASAIPDWTARVERVWSLDENGQPVAKDANGKQLYSEKTGGALTMEEWTALQVKDAAHLFEESRGSGSAPNGGKPGTPGVNGNPFKTGNLTEQGRLLKADPANATRLAAEAGVTLPQMR